MIKTLRRNSAFVQRCLAEMPAQGRVTQLKRGIPFLCSEELPLFVLPIIKLALSTGRTCFFVERGGYPLADAARAVRAFLSLTFPIYSYKTACRSTLDGDLRQEICSHVAGFLQYNQAASESGFSNQYDDHAQGSRFSPVTEHIPLLNDSLLPAMKAVLMKVHFGPLDEAYELFALNDQFREDSLFSRASIREVSPSLCLEDFTLRKSDMGVMAWHEALRVIGTKLTKQEIGVLFGVLTHVAKLKIAPWLPGAIESISSETRALHQKHGKLMPPLLFVDDGIGSGMTVYKTLIFASALGLDQRNAGFVSLRKGQVSGDELYYVSDSVDYLEDNQNMIPMQYSSGRRDQYRLNPLTNQQRQQLDAFEKRLSNVAIGLQRAVAEDKGILPTHRSERRQELLQSLALFLVEDAVEVQDAILTYGGKRALLVAKEWKRVMRPPLSPSLIREHKRIKQTIRQSLINKRLLAYGKHLEAMETVRDFFSVYRRQVLEYLVSPMENASMHNLASDSSFKLLAKRFYEMHNDDQYHPDSTLNDAEVPIERHSPRSLIQNR